MVILRTRNKITDFFMILAWASPFNLLTSTSTPTLKSLASRCQIRHPRRPVRAGLYEQTNTMANNLYLLLGLHFIIDCLYKNYY